MFCSESKQITSPFLECISNSGKHDFFCPKVTEMEKYALKNHLSPLGEEAFTAAGKFQHRREGQDSVRSGLRQCFISIITD